MKKILLAKKVLLVLAALVILILAVAPFSHAAGTVGIIPTQQENKNDTNAPTDQQLNFVPLAVLNGGEAILLLEMTTLSYDQKTNIVRFIDDLIIDGKGSIISQKSVNCTDSSTTIYRAAKLDMNDKKLDEKLFDPPTVLTKDKLTGGLQEFENNSVCSLFSPVPTNK